MSRYLSEEVVLLVKELIQKVTNYEENSEQIRGLEKQVLLKLKKGDTMSFVNQKDIDLLIDGMTQKFRFHGFSSQANRLEKAYDKFIPKDTPKSELENKLNVVKFLVCMSESPTNNFWRNPEKFVEEGDAPEEVINWAEYLNEGITKWDPGDDSNSCSSSDDSQTSPVEHLTNDGSDSCHCEPMVIRHAPSEMAIDFRANREELLCSIQHTWFNSDYFKFQPPSTWEGANIGIRWEEYLKDLVKGLLPIKSCSIITEYKVIREVIWQMFGSHRSSVFEFKENNLIPRDNVTLSSVRPAAFQTFMNEFIPYIEILDYFRDFEDVLFLGDEDNISETYKSYFTGLKNIIQPVYFKLVELEDKAREQETTFTLLILAAELQKIFEPILLLRRIHEEATLNYAFKVHHLASVDLLSGLHKSLDFSYCKLEHDIKMYLYVESLYYYFRIIDSWLMKNDFADYRNEFVIGRIKNSEPWEMGFVLRDSTDIKGDKILEIICTDVLEIGRNLCLLRKLRKNKSTSEIEDIYVSSKETIHEEFVRKFLKALTDYYDYKENDEVLEASVLETPSIEFKYPIISSEECKKPTNMDKLENLVDESDGFLMKTFESYLSITEPFDCNPKHKLSLFEKINKITTSLFPTRFFFEKIFKEILRERFTVPGLMVKKLLIEQYNLEKMFHFLQHIFLLANDLIFPFYRKLFQKINSGSKNWGNKVWLTSHLQDIMMDPFSEFYEKCNVEVKDNWKRCSDALSCLNTISIEQIIDWPLNIIISKEQVEKYQRLFKFLLKLKWGLYTLNHLVFKAIETSRKQKKPNKAYQTTITSLKYLRFSLLNLMTSLQHYILGFLYNKCLNKFELDFEKSHDLKTITQAHSNFINSLYDLTLELCEVRTGAHGFTALLQCVKLLSSMWNDVVLATNERLNECHNLYKACLKVIDPILNPVYILEC